MAETRDTRPKKQIPLRLSAKLYDQIVAWAEDDFRSVNGQIEYLLTECVRQRKKNGKYVSDTMDEPPELDISWFPTWKALLLAKPTIDNYKTIQIFHILNKSGSTDVITTVLYSPLLSIRAQRVITFRIPWTPILFYMVFNAYNVKLIFFVLCVNLSFVF